MIQLRDYQQDIIRETVKSIHEYKYQAPLVVAPTGSGKTIIFAHIATNAEKKGKRVLILVHRREILQQTMEKLYMFGVQAGQIASGHPMTPELIQVAMVSTLARRLDSIIPPDLIITDEAHHSTAGSWKKIQEKFQEVLRIGFTATPERLDGAGLIECFDTMVQGPTIRSLVESGHLSMPRMFCGPNVQQKVKIKVKMGDYDKGEQTKKMTERLIIGNVIDHYREKLNGLPTVCFCVSIEHCHVMEEEFRAAGFRSRTVHGKMTKTDRDAAIRGLGTGEVQILCSCDVISEGVDVPVIAGAILLRRTKSLALYLQQVGRALRPYPGKEEAIILDHAGNFHEHGHVLAKREWTLVAKKRSKREKDELQAPTITVCPACGGVFPGLPKVCQDCGEDLQAARDAAAGRKPPKEIAGILREVMPADTSESELAALVGQAIKIQRMDPAERQKAMISNLYKYGDDARVRGMSRVLGYHNNWTETVYRRLRRGRSA